MTDNESIFAGAAPYYARYRTPYPLALIDDLVAHYRLNGTGRLLDLGCGPGTLTLPLAPHFASVLALDINAGMIEEGRRIAAAFGAFRERDIEWRVMPAEEISPALGTFRLVTCGSSFHWMDRDLVLERIKPLLEPGCGVAMAGGGAAWWGGPEDWHQVMTAVVQSYLGDVRQAGRSGFARYAGSERFEETLARVGWRVEFNRDYPVSLTWDIDSLIGQLWSTSFASRPHFGDQVEQFEAELREALLKLHPDGCFAETIEFGLVCGRPPAAPPAS